MHRELADFLDYCRVERRLAPLTCSAYERDITACLRFLQADGIRAWAPVRPADLRRFLADEAIRRPAPASQRERVACSMHVHPSILRSTHRSRMTRIEHGPRTAAQPFAHGDLQASTSTMSAAVSPQNV